MKSTGNRCALRLTACTTAATTVQVFNKFGFERGGDWLGKEADRAHFQRVP